MSPRARYPLSLHPHNHCVSNILMTLCKWFLWFKFCILRRGESCVFLAKFSFASFATIATTTTAGTATTPGFFSSNQWHSSNCNWFSNLFFFISAGRSTWDARLKLINRYISTPVEIHTKLNSLSPLCNAKHVRLISECPWFSRKVLLNHLYNWNVKFLFLTFIFIMTKINSRRDSWKVCLCTKTCRNYCNRY